MNCISKKILTEQNIKYIKTLTVQDIEYLQIYLSKLKTKLTENVNWNKFEHDILHDGADRKNIYQHIIKNENHCNSVEILTVQDIECLQIYLSI